MKPPPNWLSAAAVVFVSVTLGLGTRSPADASVSIAVSWDGLLRESTSAAIVVPVESRAVWENGRIYTYSRVRVDRGLAGGLAAGGEAWVRTLGGIVGEVGQLVEGEAVLSAGHPSLLFVRPGPAGTFEVTARGQGQFPVVADASNTTQHVVRSNAVGMILRPRVPVPNATPVLASEVLHGRSVDDAALAITSAWGRTHAP